MNVRLQRLPSVLMSDPPHTPYQNLRQGVEWQWCQEAGARWRVPEIPALQRLIEYSQVGLAFSIQWVPSQPGVHSKILKTLSQKPQEKKWKEGRAWGGVGREAGVDQVRVKKSKGIQKWVCVVPGTWARDGFWESTEHLWNVCLEGQKSGSLFNQLSFLLVKVNDHSFQHLVWACGKQLSPYAALEKSGDGKWERHLRNHGTCV